IALWGADDRDRGEAFTVHAALSVQSGLVIVSLPAEGGSFPEVSDIFPAASRMQRALRDLLGIEAQGAPDQRKWLRHAAWPEDEFPLRKDFNAGRQSPVSSLQSPRDDYSFIRVEGEGVHEIPVGPVHAGTIEPGHFRFSIVGEG